MAAPSWISEDYSWRMFNSRVVISVSRSTPKFYRLFGVGPCFLDVSGEGPDYSPVGVGLA